MLESLFTLLSIPHIFSQSLPFSVSPHTLTLLTNATVPFILLIKTYTYITISKKFHTIRQQSWISSCTIIITGIFLFVLLLDLLDYNVRSVAESWLGLSLVAFFGAYYYSLVDLCLDVMEHNQEATLFVRYANQKTHYVFLGYVWIIYKTEIFCLIPLLEFPTIFFVLGNLYKQSQPNRIFLFSYLLVRLSFHAAAIYLFSIYYPLRTAWTLLVLTISMH